MQMFFNDLTFMLKLKHTLKQEKNVNVAAKASFFSSVNSNHDSFVKSNMSISNLFKSPTQQIPNLKV